MTAPKGNQYARKAEADKVFGKGRCVIDLGPLKTRAVRAAQSRGQTLKAFVSEAIEDKLTK